MEFWKLVFVGLLSAAIGVGGTCLYYRSQNDSQWELKVTGQVVARMDKKTGRTQLIVSREWKDVAEGSPVEDDLKKLSSSEAAR